ncbi:ABC transporter permease [Kaustia mangrovi]|uniref:ABC transporter permease n=1 Tax=Kaustia mangrovi TaxID=2593653 RepID=A0A7S8HDB6_9HYPH|nr:ABC transporter permease [Kaustia mangrovi]QPC44143.1 ABC transporter permease [Kaustia mangrovi]
MKTVQFILGRFLGAVATMFIGALAVFLVMQAAPGDPALAALGESATPEAVAAFRAERNLDAPLTEQFASWLQGVAQGDFGKSLTIAGGIPISELVVTRLPNTLFVGLYAIVFAVAVSLFMGSLAAIKRGRMSDTVATSISALGVSMPDFWLGYVLILVFALTLGWLPSYGFTSPFESLSGAFVTGLLPALAIAAPMAAVFARTLRTSLLENSGRDYVTVARSFGFSRPFVFEHYVFRNSIIPYIVIVGLQIRYLLGGVVVVERVFGVPGVGSLMVDAAFARDYPVVQACTIVFLTIVLSVNFTVDIICAALDPKRTR